MCEHSQKKKSIHQYLHQSEAFSHDQRRHHSTQLLGLSKVVLSAKIRSFASVLRPLRETNSMPSC